MNGRSVKHQPFQASPAPPHDPIYASSTGFRVGLGFDGPWAPASNQEPRWASPALTPRRASGTRWRQSRYAREAGTRWDRPSPEGRRSECSYSGGSSPRERGPRRAGGAAIGTGLEPVDHDGNRVRLSLTRSEMPMNTGRPVSVGTHPGAPVPRQDALSTIRELVNRSFAGDLNGETRTRTGDTTIFSRLPYAAECGRFAAKSRARITSPCSRGFPHFGCDCGRVRHTIANLCLIDSRLAAPCPPACRCRAIGPARRR